VRNTSLERGIWPKPKVMFVLSLSSASFAAAAETKIKQARSG
jgi:hypothetical protein